MEHSPLLFFRLGMEFQIRINSNARKPLAPSIKVESPGTEQELSRGCRFENTWPGKRGEKNENVNSLESTLPGYTDKHIGLHLVKGKA